jgi:large subunit ribosomal protein L32
MTATLFTALTSGFNATKLRLFLPTITIPLTISINIPSLSPGIFESILRAVPKKKQSHSRKRMRQLAGKALEDVTALNRCSGCGQQKRSHLLCDHCVQQIKNMRLGKNAPQTKNETDEL